MKNTLKVLGMIALITAIIFSFAACGDDSGNNDNTTVVIPDPVTVELTGVSITGAAEIGKTLTACVTPSDVTGAITYQWKANGINVSTNSSYPVTADDLGKTITVTATSARSVSFTSPATAAVEYANLVPASSIKIENHTSYPDSLFTTVGGYGGNTGMMTIAERILYVYNNNLVHPDKTSHPAEKIIIGNANSYKLAEDGTHAIVTIDSSFYSVGSGVFNVAVATALGYAYSNYDPLASLDKKKDVRMAQMLQPRQSPGNTDVAPFVLRFIRDKFITV